MTRKCKLNVMLYGLRELSVVLRPKDNGILNYTLHTFPSFVGLGKALVKTSYSGLVKETE